MTEVKFELTFPSTVRLIYIPRLVSDSSSSDTLLLIPDLMLSAKPCKAYHSPRRANVNFTDCSIIGIVLRELSSIKKSTTNLDLARDRQIRRITTDGMNRDRTCASMRHPSPCRDKTRHLTTELSASRRANVNFTDCSIIGIVLRELDIHLHAFLGQLEICPTWLIFVISWGKFCFMNWINTCLGLCGLYVGTTKWFFYHSKFEYTQLYCKDLVKIWNFQQISSKSVGK